MNYSEDLPDIKLKRNTDAREFELKKVVEDYIEQGTLASVQDLNDLKDEVNATKSSLESVNARASQLIEDVESTASEATDVVDEKIVELNEAVGNANAANSAAGEALTQANAAKQNADAAVEQASSALSDIGTAKTEATSAIADSKTDALSAIGTSQTSAVGAVESATLAYLAQKFPVGYIFTTADISTRPASLFGGTWEIVEAYGYEGTGSNAAVNLSDPSTLPSWIESVKWKRTA